MLYVTVDAVQCVNALSDSVDFFPQDFDPEDLNSGNLKFFPKTLRNQTTVSTAEVETHVVYFAVKPKAEGC